METVRRWREWCIAQGIGDLYLCAVQSFGFNDPRPFGFDAAVEFPPHCPWDRYPDLPYLKELEDVPGLVKGFSGKVYDYRSFASAAMARPREPYTLHRTSMAAWDNTARRGKTAHVYHGFNIDTFERWVATNARRAAVEQGDGISFINAWNEWAEGTVLEPDAHFGYEVLETTRRAMAQARLDAKGTYWFSRRPLLPEKRVETRERLILVGHDAFPSGAQINLLNMARTLKRELQMDVVIFLIEGGELLDQYERVAPTYLIGKDGDWRDLLRRRLKVLAVHGVRKAICNTAVTGDVVEVLEQEGFRTVSLVHEMPTVI